MQNQFINIKRGTLGRLITSLNSPETIANKYASPRFGSINVLDELQMLFNISLDDLYEAQQRFINVSRTADFTIVPSKI